MRCEFTAALAARAGEMIAAEFDGALSGLTPDQMPAGIAALILKVLTPAEVWNPAWDL